MEYSVRLTGRALRDLEWIYEFVHAASWQKAAVWFRKLSETIYSLERFPKRGKIVRENKRLRQMVFGQRPGTYRIIYSVEERTRKVTVLHIRHTARTPQTDV